jgi:hypothetical protein
VPQSGFPDGVKGEWLGAGWSDEDLWMRNDPAYSNIPHCRYHFRLHQHQGEESFLRIAAATLANNSEGGGGVRRTPTLLLSPSFGECPWRRTSASSRHTVCVKDMSCQVWRGADVATRGVSACAGAEGGGSSKHAFRLPDYNNLVEMLARANRRVQELEDRLGMEISTSAVGRS